VLNSTAHFRQILNGYSGYTPDSYIRHAAEFAGFPDEPALHAMRKAGATHVMVHAKRLYHSPERNAAILDQIAASPALERMAIGRDGVTLYRLR
jgi:hypothetical protein